MGKRTTSISVESSLLDFAKSKPKFILSEFVEEQLRQFFDINEDEINRLNSLQRIQEEKARKSAELSILKEKERQLKEEAEKEKAEANRWKEI